MKERYSIGRKAYVLKQGKICKILSWNTSINIRELFINCHANNVIGITRISSLM